VGRIGGVSAMGTVIGLAAFLVVVWVLGSGWFKGALGEFRVRRWLRTRLDGNDYQVFNDLTVPTRDGTTQIDHVIVSRFGVFVVETKNMKGWIFGSADRAAWTQVIYRRKSKFQNPIHQNYKHIKAIQDLLRVEKHKLHGIVAFVGSATAKSVMPLGVVWGARSLVEAVKSKRVAVLTEDEVRTFAARLSDDTFRSDMQTRSEHVKQVKAQVASRRDPGNCPRCGAELVERTNRQSGDKFLACNRYPSCKGTRPLS
jgi:restriction system protein